MELQELVAGFAAACKLEGLSLDAGGVAVFEADEMLVRISNQAETRSFVLEGEIGDPPPECREAFEHKLLELNLTLLPAAGVSIAVTQNDAYVLQAVGEYEHLTSAAFVARIQKFLDELERLRTLLESFTMGSESVAEATAEATAQARAAAFGGFIQV